MRRFFSRNIGFQGRMVRGVIGAVLLIAGIMTTDSHLLAGILLVAVALFVLFEAVRGWCFARACGIKTRL